MRCAVTDINGQEWKRNQNVRKQYITNNIRCNEDNPLLRPTKLKRFPYIKKKKKKDF